MSDKKQVDEIARLIILGFQKDKDITRALRRINTGQMNLARRALPEDAKALGSLKLFFKKKGGENQNG